MKEPLNSHNYLNNLPKEKKTRKIKIKSINKTEILPKETIDFAVSAFTFIYLKNSAI